MFKHYSLRRQIRAVEREIAFRKRKSPDFIKQGTLTEDQARHHIEVMECVLETLRERLTDGGITAKENL